MAKPDSSYFKALDTIWKYLNKYPCLIKYYNCNIPVNSYNIRGYTNASWASDIESRKSITGYCFYIYNNIIQANTIKQKSIALSSCEAEYIAFKEAIKEGVYLNNIFLWLNNNLGIKVIYKIPPILIDLASAIKLAKNPKFYKRSKYIDIAYYFLREAIR